MKLKYLTITFCMFGSVKLFSLPCEEALDENFRSRQAASNEQETAKSVFNNYIENSRHIIGEKFQVSFQKDLKYWSGEEALKFLKLLEERVGKKRTLEILKSSVSTLQTVSYRNFIKHLTFFENLFGSDEVNLYLKKNPPKVFFHFSEKRGMLFIDFLKKKWGEKEAFRLLRQNLDSLIHARKNEFQSMEKFLLPYFGGSRERLDSFIKNNFFYFVQMRVSRTQPVIQFLEKYVKSMEGFLNENVSTAATVRLENLQPVIEFLEKYLNRRKLSEKIQNSFSTFHRFQLEKLEPVINFVLERIGRKRLIQKLEGSIHIPIDIQTLEALEEQWGKVLMTELLIDYPLRSIKFLKKPESREETLELQEVTMLLEKYFNEDQIKKIFSKYSNQLASLTIGDLYEALKNAESVMSRYEMFSMILKDMPKFMILSSLFKIFPFYSDHLQKEWWIRGLEQKSLKEIKDIKKVISLITEHAGPEESSLFIEDNFSSIIEVKLEDFEQRMLLTDQGVFSVLRELFSSSK